MYKCSDCDGTFKDPACRDDGEYLEVWGADRWRSDFTDVCPYCGSDNIEAEVYECQCCGEVTQLEDGYDWCESCAPWAQYLEL